MPTTIFSSHSILYFCLLWTSVHDVSNLDGLAHQLTNKLHQNPELMSILLVEKKIFAKWNGKKKKKKKRSSDEAATATREIIVLVFLGRILSWNSSKYAYYTVTEPTTFALSRRKPTLCPSSIPIFGRRSLTRWPNDRRQRKDVFSLVVGAVQTRPSLRFYEHRAWVFIAIQSRVCAIRYRATIVEESRRGVLETPKTRGVWYRSGVEEGGWGQRNRFMRCSTIIIHRNVGTLKRSSHLCLGVKSKRSRSRDRCIHIRRAYSKLLKRSV